MFFMARLARSSVTRSTYRWRVTVEGTRAAISSPRGRMVLRAAEAASSGPPCPNTLK